MGPLPQQSGQGLSVNALLVTRTRVVGIQHLVAGKDITSKRGVARHIVPKQIGRHIRRSIGLVRHPPADPTTPSREAPGLGSRGEPPSGCSLHLMFQAHKSSKVKLHFVIAVCLNCQSADSSGCAPLEKAMPSSLYFSEYKLLLLQIRPEGII